MRCNKLVVLGAVVLAVVVGAPNAEAGYLNGLDFGERCFRFGAGVGGSVVPGVPGGVGAAESGCVTDSGIRHGGVLEATYMGAVHVARVGPYSAGGGAAGSTSSRAGVSRIAWAGGLVSHTFYLTNSHSVGPATVCARIRDGNGVTLSLVCRPLDDGEITVSATLGERQYHEALVELTADYMFPTTNVATVTVSRYTSLLP